MFANTTFWVAQRVPSRTHYVSVVKNHGGNVTSLEKNADFLIADHVRHRDAPPGALSYRFLEECVQQGRLLSLDERTTHLCGPKPGSVREVADASRASKAHRTAFTPEDDGIIREWVKDAVRRGESHGGNEIWKDLERQNKRHTWQSWRDRWVKKLRDRMPPQWDTEIRGLDDDVDELVQEVLEEEARSEALQQEEQESQIKERGEEGEQERRWGLHNQKENDRQGESSEQEAEEGHSKIDETEKSEREKFKAPQHGNESLPGVDKAETQRPPTQPREIPEMLRRSGQTVLQRDQEKLSSGGTSLRLNSAASPQHSPTPVVLQRVAQAKLIGGKTWPDVQFMPSSPPVPIRASDADAQPRSESERSERVRADFAREPSAGVFSNRSKRPKLDPAVATANEEECSTLKDRLSPDIRNDGQTSQKYDIRPKTSNRKRARDGMEVPPQFRSLKAVETANISRQRIEINSQSTASGASQAESSGPIDDDDDDTKVLQTQAILAADTQPLDLDIPDPDEALESSIAQSIESEEPVEFDRQCQASLRDQELINQQLLDKPDAGENEAMDFDFDLPEPDGGFEAAEEPYEGIETELLKDTQALDPGPIEEMDVEDIDEAASQASLDFDALANALMDKGHSPDNILTAIQATSANMPLMLVVLEHLRAGMNVPVEVRGIWTKQDDEDILGGDARKLERVEAKHGWDGEGGCKARQYFLRDSIAAAEELARQSTRTA